MLPIPPELLVFELDLHIDNGETDCSRCYLANASIRAWRQDAGTT